MSDIVERLQDLLTAAMPLERRHTIMAARDEIKRLRKLGDADYTIGLEEEVARLDAEIERLHGEIRSMGAHMAQLHRRNDDLRAITAGKSDG